MLKIANEPKSESLHLTDFFRLKRNFFYLINSSYLFVLICIFYAIPLCLFLSVERYVIIGSLKILKQARNNRRLMTIFKYCSAIHRVE